MKLILEFIVFVVSFFLIAVALALISFLFTDRPSGGMIAALSFPASYWIATKTSLVKYFMTHPDAWKGQKEAEKKKG